MLGGGRKERAVVAGLLGVVLLLFELVLIARMVVDWIGVLSPDGGRSGLYQARRITHGITEPVIGPVRRVLKPARLGSVSIDLAFTAVFLACDRLADGRSAVDSVLRPQPQRLNVAAPRPVEETVDLCYVIALSTRVRTVSGGPSPLNPNHADVCLSLRPCSSAASQRAERSTNFVISAASSDTPR